MLSTPSERLQVVRARSICLSSVFGFFSSISPAMFMVGVLFMRVGIDIAYELPSKMLWSAWSVAQYPV